MRNDTLDETKGFKYQITIKVELKKKTTEIELKKYKKSEIEFSTVCFNSTTKNNKL